ncbi:MAG: cobalamin-binding protein [Porticoccaceae bacterium]
MVRRLAWLLLCMALALLAFGAMADIRLQDDLGDELVLAAPAARIVSLAPNVTETLFAIGAGQLIVGADEYSNYPREARDIPRVNNHAAANYERILALKPDLVIAWQSGNSGQIIPRLRRLGLPVFVIEPRTLEDIAGVARRFGAITGHTVEAQRLAATFEAKLAELRQTFSARTPVKVFYQIWNEPLITLNGSHLVSDVIRLCGGTNVFADAAPLVPYVNIEAVISADPQVIIASGSNDESPAWLTMWQRWPAISAVKHGHIYSVPPDLIQRHSLRIIDGAGQVCAFLDKARG